MLWNSKFNLNQIKSCLVFSVGIGIFVQETDIEAGKAANVTMVCVASGLAQKETLEKHHPDILVDNTEQLIKLFDI